MPLHKTQAIVLRAINLNDTDKLVTFFTGRYGKIKCVAKAARRIKSRFGAALQPMSHIQMIYFGKENQDLYKLNLCDIIESFQSVREDARKLYTAVYFAELVDTLVKEGERHRELFDFVLQALHRVRELENLETLRRLFEIRFISHLGYTPHLSHCVACKKPPGQGQLGFSYDRGGILCEPCTGRIHPPEKLTAGTLNYLKKLLTVDIKLLGRLKIPGNLEPEIENITHRLILSHVGRELKSYPFIKQMAIV